MLNRYRAFFDIPVDHLYASPVFAKYLEEFRSENLTVISPDVGGMKMAAAYADILDCPFGLVAKRRTNATTVQAINLVGEVEGLDVLLVDDMTETAGTLIAAAKLVREKGAKSVRALVSHGVLNKVGYDRLQANEGILDELITTNSVPIEPNGLPISVVSIAGLLGEAILRIHNHSSVTSLFKVKGY